MRCGKLLILIGLAIIVAASGSYASMDQNRRKARYYYAAGTQCQAVGDDAGAYEYYKRAYAADPQYVEAASAYGSYRLRVATEAMQSADELENSLGYMRQYVDQYPDDYYESLYYGFIAGQAGDADDAIGVLERTYARHPDQTSLLLQLSDTYARNNRLDKAVERISDYERESGLSPQLTMRKISYLLAAKDTLGSLNEVTRLVAANPKDPSCLILKGNLYDILSQPDSAFHYYQFAEQIDPESGAAKLALAGYYQEHGDSVSYDEKMYEVLLSEDLGVEEKIDLTAGYLQTLIGNKQSWDRGDYLFEQLRKQYPHDAKVLDLAARYSAAKGDFKDAEDQIGYAIDQDQSNVTYWSQLMSYQGAGDNPERVFETYEDMKKHAEPDENIQRYYASVAQYVKRYDLAIDMYKQMIKDIDSGLQPDSVLSLSDLRRDVTVHDLDMLTVIYGSLGDVYNAAGEFEKSYRAYDNALEVDPRNIMAKNNYAYFLAINGDDLDKAEKLSAEVVNGEGADSPTYLDTYAWIQYLKGNYETAEKYQRKAVEAMQKDNSESAEVYMHLGDILLKRNDNAGALEAYEQSVELQRKHDETDEPEYKETLAKIEKLKKLTSSK